MKSNFTYMHSSKRQECLNSYPRLLWNFSLILHLNPTSGSFLKFRYIMGSETMSVNVHSLTN